MLRMPVRLTTDSGYGWPVVPVKIDRRAGVVYLIFLSLETGQVDHRNRRSVIRALVLIMVGWGQQTVGLEQGCADRRHSPRKLGRSDRGQRPRRVLPVIGFIRHDIGWRSFCSR